MKAKTNRLRRIIGTPRVSKYRTFSWLPAGTVPDSATVAIVRDDAYFFGVLHARPHEIWSLRMGTFLGKGTDPRYTPTTTFETYPFPWPPGQEPVDHPHVVAIGDAAAELVRLRDGWLNPPDLPDSELKKRTLTNLYNERPAWLADAHQALDRMVFIAYGWDYPPRG